MGRLLQLATSASVPRKPSSNLRRLDSNPAFMCSANTISTSVPTSTAASFCLAEPLCTPALRTICRMRLRPWPSQNEGPKSLRHSSASTPSGLEDPSSPRSLLSVFQARV